MDYIHLPHCSHTPNINDIDLNTQRGQYEYDPLLNKWKDLYSYGLPEVVCLVRYKIEFAPLSAKLVEADTGD